MSAVYHSRLLKLVVLEEDLSKMAGKPPKFKFNFNPNIECEVPGEQALREPTSGTTNRNGPLAHEDTVEIREESFVPVLKVTKNEASFTKGDLRLQKVTVEEDVSVKFQHLFKKQSLPGKTVTVEVQKFEYKY